MVGGDSDSLEAYAVKSNRQCTTFTSLFFERHKVPRAICAGEIFFFISDLFYMMKTFEQNRPKGAGGFIG